GHLSGARYQYPAFSLVSITCWIWPFMQCKRMMFFNSSLDSLTPDRTKYIQRMKQRYDVSLETRINSKRGRAFPPKYPETSIPNPSFPKSSDITPSEPLNRDVIFH